MIHVSTDITRLGTMRSLLQREIKRENPGGGICKELARAEKARKTISRELKYFAHALQFGSTLDHTNTKHGMWETFCAAAGFITEAVRSGDADKIQWIGNKRLEMAVAAETYFNALKLQILQPEIAAQRRESAAAAAFRQGSAPRPGRGRTRSRRRMTGALRITPPSFSPARDSRYPCGKSLPAN